MSSRAKSLVFISSVQKEFQDERRALKDYIEGDALLRRFFTVFLFEDLPASGESAQAVYLNEVDRSAIYIGLFGVDYGFEDPAGVSPTEREFDRATRLGRERLVFVRNADDAARHPKMRALIARASRDVVRRRFGSSAELNAGVYASLVGFLERTGALRTMASATASRGSS